MKKCYVYVANGFEEIELITPIDLFRRAGINVVTVSIGPGLIVTGSHNIAINCDIMFEDSDFADGDIFFLPGGPGHQEMLSHDGLFTVFKNAFSDGKLVTAICAAPTVLAKMGILNGKNAVCYPGMENLLTGANVLFDDVCIDGNIITGRGLGCAMDFSLAIINKTLGEDADFIAKLKESIVYNK